MGSSSDKYTVRNYCRLCEQSTLTTVLSLEATPPANSYVSKQECAKEQECFPLTLALCGNCGHAQLKEVVDPTLLFNSYLYVSGTSPVYRKHLKDYADGLVRRFGLNSSDKVFELGSNDGTFLGYFQDHGLQVLGVDPAKNLAQTANDNDIETIAKFFSSNLSRSLVDKYGTYNLVVANHVFAHIDDLEDIVRGVEHLLSGSGVFVFEVGYFMDVFRQGYFDTIYHEHVSFHTVKPLVQFFNRLGMEIFEVENTAAQGGSLRVYVQKAAGTHTVSSNVADFIQAEERVGIFSVETFSQLRKSIEFVKGELADTLGSLAASGKKIAAYGAPAKATTLMYHFGLTERDIAYIVDDNPLKQGMFTPGLHIPIVSVAELEKKPVDIIVILAWNFAEPIMKKMQLFARAGGKFIIPFPSVKII